MDEADGTRQMTGQGEAFCITHKLKLDFNFVTSEFFTNINLYKALLIKREKCSSIVTKLEFYFCGKVVLG